MDYYYYVQRPYIPNPPVDEQIVPFYYSGGQVYGGRPGRSGDAGGEVFELEMAGCSICNTDGTEGLTFDEINACRVNYNLT